MTDEQIKAIEDYIGFRKAEFEKLNDLITVKKDNLPKLESIILVLKKLDYETTSEKWKDFLMVEKNFAEFLKTNDNKDRNFIYKIDIISPNNTPNDIVNEAIYFKQNNKVIALSRINKETKSNVLYIGSSEKGIEKRLKEHLGFGSKSTYSMQLHHLIRESNLTELSIEISIFSFGNSIGTTLLKNIEFAFWHKYKPILGKGELDLNTKKL